VSPTFVDGRVVAEKIALIDRMVADLRALPADDLGTFLEDRRTPAAAESFLRRALEALMDLGRHLLAKGFGQPVDEYAAIADRLQEVGVLSSEEAATLRKMAKYRNRMVHFYDEITQPELHGIATRHLNDFGTILGAINRWLAEHPDRVRESA
jgi:uncharacterized protein YutE (UPF0331/DUF86 family)